MSNLNQPVQTVQALKDQILALRSRTELQKENMGLHWNDLKQSITPVNLLRQVGISLISPGKGNELVKTALGMGSGYLLKNVLFGKSKGFFGKLWAAGGELLIARMVTGRFTRAGRQQPSRSAAIHSPNSPAPAKVILDKTGARFDPPVNLISHIGRVTSHSSQLPVLFLAVTQR